MKNILYILVFIPMIATAQLKSLDEIDRHSNTAPEMWQNFIRANDNFEYLEGLVLKHDTNYVKVIIDTLTVKDITYTDTYWEDLRVPMTNTLLTPSKSEPALEEIVTGVLAYAFEADADSSERLNFIAQLPHERKAGSDLECHLHWAPSTTNTGNVYWRFTYTVISIDGTFGAVTSMRVLDAGDGTAVKHQLIELGTITGTTLGTSSILIGNITRLGEHTSDSFTGVAYGLEFDIHYEIDSPGSHSETIK